MIFMPSKLAIEYWFLVKGWVTFAGKTFPVYGFKREGNSFYIDMVEPQFVTERNNL